MSAKRIIAITVVYLVACGGWGILGVTTQSRSAGSTSRLNYQVEKQWGSPLAQVAPSWAVDVPGSESVRWLTPTQNEIKVRLETDYRKKGLLWYPTYICLFSGSYKVTNNEEAAQKVRLHFAFPAKGATYDSFVVKVDDEPLATPIDTNEGINEIVELQPGESKTLLIAYATRGLREWRYQIDPNVNRVKNLNLVVETGFRNLDYPDGSLSPTSAKDTANGMVLTWDNSDLITSQDIGVVIPEKLNPGPLTSRITFFAPVCLIFFFVLIATINILHKIDIHPMHYLFVAAGFFAFHLLLAYMAGIIHIHIAFIVSAIVSVVLVTTYMSAALQGRFPWKIAVASQSFFLVLFSYSFFLKGLTGLVVAIGSVVTLAILMRATASIDWNIVFTRPGRRLNSPPSPERTDESISEPAANSSPENQSSEDAEKEANI